MSRRIETGLGGMEQSNVARKAKPRGFWEPEVIEEQSISFYEENGVLTQRALLLARRADLSSAIRKYPGRLRGLKEKMGLEPGRKLKGYWTKKNILEQAEAFLSSEGKLTFVLLNQKRPDLSGAISFNYPGKMTQLKRDLGIRPSRRTSPWTEDQVREEASRFYQQEGRIAHSLLLAKGRSDVSVAINRAYKGGMSQLLKDLGLKVNQREYGYWKVEKIEEEALAIIQQFGDLSHSLLVKNGQNALLVAIRQKYSGGMAALREKLGVNSIISESVIDSSQANEQLAKLMEAK